MFPNSQNAILGLWIWKQDSTIRVLSTHHWSRRICEEKVNQTVFINPRNGGTNQQKGKGKLDNSQWNGTINPILWLNEADRKPRRRSTTKSGTDPKSLFSSFGDDDNIVFEIPTKISRKNYLYHNRSYIVEAFISDDRDIAEFLSEASEFWIIIIIIINIIIVKYYYCKSSAKFFSP